MSKIPGIYCIINLMNNKIYIGSSMNLKERIRNHIKSLNSGKHQNPHLQNSWNKYGKDNFLFEIIEEYNIISKEDLLKREQIWIDFTNCCDRNIGYNIYNIAGSSFGAKKSEEFKEVQRLKSNSKPILQFNTDGSFVKRWHSIKEIYKKTGFYYGTIKDVICQKRGYLAYGYIWIYESEYDENIFDVKNYTNNKNQSKKIIQLTTDDCFVKEWSNLKQIKESGCFNINCVISVCKGRRKRTGGYKWMYEADYIDLYNSQLI